MNAKWSQCLVRFLLLLALCGCLAQLVELGARVEFDDGWYTSMGYTWRTTGLLSRPSWAESRGIDPTYVFPVTSLLSWAAQAALPGWSPVVAARLPFWICAGFGLALVVRGVSRRLDAVAGAAAGAFLAWQTFPFLNARTVRPESVVALVWAPILLHFLTPDRGRNRGWWALAGSLMGLGWFAIHPNCVLLSGLLFAGWFAASPARRECLGAAAAFWTACGVAWFLFLWIAPLLLGVESVLSGPGDAVQRAKAGLDAGGWASLATCVRMWTMAPYRLPVIVCVVLACARGWCRPELRALCIAALGQMLFCAFIRGTENLRYLAFVDLLVAPVVGAAVSGAFDELRDGGSMRMSSKALLFAFALAVGTGVALPVEMLRLRSTDASLMRAWLGPKLPAGRPVIGSLWIAGILPERALILGMRADRMTRVRLALPVTVVEDGVYADGRVAREVLEARGLKAREVGRMESPRLGLIRIVEMAAEGRSEVEIGR